MNIRKIINEWYSYSLFPYAHDNEHEKGNIKELLVLTTALINLVAGIIKLVKEIN
ncbi:hypothetical protein [Peptoniphilus obesi]|uniref:hypothetical protein n=1 Tax=Peptoniphilus obesi TaxID=1472765 RepID=UPI0004B6676E|nr:hypothetical protein [Peptoniphilus obesi]